MCLLDCSVLRVGKENHLYFRSAVVHSNIFSFLNSKHTEETNVQMELHSKYYIYIYIYIYIYTHTRIAMCFESIFNIWSCQFNFI